MMGMDGHGPFHGADRAEDEETFGKVYDQRVIRRMIPFILPFRHLLGLATVAMLVYVATLSSVPWIIKLGIDRYILNDDFSGLTWLFGVFVVIALINWGAGYAQDIIMARIGQGLLYGLRRQLFSHLQRLSVSFYDKTEVGRLMSRIHGDVGQLQEFGSLMVMTLGEMLSLVGIVAFLLIINVKLALITMAVVPLLGIIMAVWQPLARKQYLRARRAASVVNGALNENITGVRVVQAMNRQERNLELFDNKSRYLLGTTMTASRLSSGLLPPVDILTAVAIGLAIFFGSRLFGEDLEIGALIAFVMYIQRFFDPIRNLTMSYTQLQRAMASGIRIFDLLDAEPDLRDAADARPIPRLKGEIEFQDVSFSYVPGDDVLKKVSLHVNPGETVAIVGPTGAGKTTLVSLLSRFYEVPRGRGAILVDGQDIRDVTRHSLVSQMSMVLQEPFLFSDTVRENIKYNHTQVTDEQMIEAAKAVGAHDFIIRLEDGYDTVLEERGVNLSVGQRQLISFARAIVADPRILILDEATANVDSYTEMLIQRALLRLFKGRTAIVIAHRLSTIRGADKIVVLNLGQVEEVGSHTQLMAQNGLYAHLYQINYAAIEAPVNGSENGR
ncbi:MAG: ABC transporter ATP-binding protein [Chloroflexi bacterium]|nr:ABC transporter ATP-binding protein [Chloroflexota bacterium]